MLGAVALLAPTSGTATPSAGASSTAFATGELVVVTSGATRLRSDGSRIGQLQGRAAPLAVSIAVDGTPLLGDSAGLIETYDSNGAFTSAFGLFPVPYVIAALARAPDGILYVAVSQGQATDIYAFQPSRGARNRISASGKVVDLDVAADSCTLYYALSTGEVRRVNGCVTSAIRPDFATNARATAVRLMPDGTLLLAGVDRIVRRVLPNGDVAAKYPAPTGSGGWTSALDLTPDGGAFWAATRSGRVYQMSLVSRRVLRGPVATGGTVRDLAVVGAPRGLPPRVDEAPGPESLDVDGVFPLTSQVSSMVQDRPEPRDSCPNDLPGTLEYVASGPSVGPYEGTFEAGGRVSFGRQNLSAGLGPLALSPGRITEVTAAFTVRSPKGNVRGTLGVPRTNSTSNVATCARFANRIFPGSTAFPGPMSGYFWAISAPRLRYQATIEVNGRTYRDRGTSQIYRDEYELTHANGALGGFARRYTQSWQSESFGLTDSFDARGQVRSHTAGLGRTTKVVELVLTWRDPGDSFAVTGVRHVGVGKRTLQSTTKLKPRDPRVEVLKRSSVSLRLRITNLKRTRLAFAIKPRALTGPALVTIDVRRR